MSISLLLQTRGGFVDVSGKLGRSHSPMKAVLPLFTQSHWKKMIDGPRFALYHMCNTKSLYSVLLCLDVFSSVQFSRSVVSDRNTVGCSPWGHEESDSTE